MALQLFYKGSDLAQVQMALLSSTGELQLARSKVITNPQWILTKDGENKTLIASEEELLQELKTHVGSFYRAPDEEQPSHAGRWTKYFRSGK